MGINNFFLSRPGIYLLAYPLLILIGFLDYQTGHEFSSSVLYFFPIYLIAANRENQKIDSLLIALFCSLSWLCFHVLSGYTYTSTAILFWNGFVRVATFFLISLLLYRLKRNRMYVEVMNQKLERANEEKNKYMGIAAHDIRNPLANIYSISVLLGGDKDLTDKQQELVSLLNKISSSALTLLTNLLDISQIESGSLRLQKEPQDYGTFLEEQILFNRHMAQKKDQKIVFLRSDKPNMLCFDSTYMGQVLNNLLSNSIKYSPPGSRIEVRLEDDSDYVRTIVKDQGAGISPQDLEKIFRPFAKGANRPTAGESSSGLGLAIVKKLVEAHGGQVGVESQYGTGSSFHFTIPKG